MWVVWVGLSGGEAKYNLFFFNDTATTEIYTLSLHDALPIFLAVSAALKTRHHGLASFVFEAGHYLRSAIFHNEIGRAHV